MVKKLISNLLKKGKTRKVTNPKSSLNDSTFRENTKDIVGYPKILVYDYRKSIISRGVANISLFAKSPRKCGIRGREYRGEYRE